MANPSTAHEPSMEEILASIRQIISEDGEASTPSRTETQSEANPESPAAENPKSAAAESEPSVARAEVALAKGDAMKPQTVDSPARPAQQRTSPITASEPAAEALRRHEFEPGKSEARPPQPAQRAGRAIEEKNLLSAHSDAAVSGAFSALAHTILAQNARTLEDLVVEMLQPMLHDWLDENLPSLVERLVKEEIERVSRGRR
jgi:cell pole-organizing protein PopZ